MRKCYVGQLMSVYVHISPTNKIYVGATKLKPEHRWGLGGMSYQCNIAFWNDIQQYGWDNFQHLVVATKLDAEVALQLESDLIHEYQTTNPEFGYNHVTGGGYVGEISPSMREKFSERSRDRLWIHKGTIEKSIKHEQLEHYQANGWDIGRPPGYTIYVHKDRITKRANRDTIYQYIADGWELGKDEHINVNIAAARQEYAWIIDEKEFPSAMSAAEYMREHYYPKIVASTITAAFNGVVFKSYPDLLEHIRRVPTGNTIRHP